MINATTTEKSLLAEMTFKNIEAALKGFKDTLVFLNNEKVLNAVYTKDELFTMFHSAVNVGFDKGILTPEQKSIPNLYEIFYKTESGKIPKPVLVFLEKYDSHEFSQPGVLFGFRHSDDIVFVIESMGKTPFIEIYIKDDFPAYKHADVNTVLERMKLMNERLAYDMKNDIAESDSNEKIYNSEEVAMSIYEEFERLGDEYGFEHIANEFALPKIESIKMFYTAVEVLLKRDDYKKPIDLEELANFIFNYDHKAEKLVRDFMISKDTEIDYANYLSEGIKLLKFHFKWMKKNEINENTTLEEITEMKTSRSTLLLQQGIKIEYHIMNSDN